MDIDADKKIKALEKCLEQQKNKIDTLQKIIRSIPGNVYWKNKKGEYLGCNDEFSNLLGFKSNHEIVGKTDFDLLSVDLAKKIFEADRKIFDGQEHEIILEEVGKNCEGEKAIYWSKKKSLLNEKNELICLLGVSLDITQKTLLTKRLNELQEELNKTNQEKLLFIKKMRHFEELIKILPGNVFWKSRSGEYLGCNDNMAKILNLKSNRDIVGKTAIDLVGAEKGKIITEQDERIMANGDIFSIEEPGLDIHGNPAFYITKKTPIHDEKGELIGLLGISMDITARKHLEENLKKAKEKSEEANRIKIDFMKNMEHDIRTPFSGIYGMAKYLLDEEIDDNKKEFLNDIACSAKELLDYCNTVLEYSKIEAKETVVLDKKFDLREIMNKVIAIELPASRIKNVEIKIDFSDHIPTMLIGDDYRLYRILLNLVSNAVKFTEKGWIKIGAELLKKENRQVIVKVNIEDTGIGISKEQQQFIYAKFNRLIPSNRGLYKGLGLGLSIVKKFVEEMEGEIDVFSEQGRGTNVICIFPFRVPLIEK